MELSLSRANCCRRSLLLVWLLPAVGLRKDSCPQHLGPLRWHGFVEGTGSRSPTGMQEMPLFGTAECAHRICKLGTHHDSHRTSSCDSDTQGACAPRVAHHLPQSSPYTKHTSSDPLLDPPRPPPDPALIPIRQSDQARRHPPPPIFALGF